MTIIMMIEEDGSSCNNRDKLMLDKVMYGERGWMVKVFASNNNEANDECRSSGWCGKLWWWWHYCLMLVTSIIGDSGSVVQQWLVMIMVDVVIRGEITRVKEGHDHIVAIINDRW